MGGSNKYKSKTGVNTQGFIINSSLNSYPLSVDIGENISISEITRLIMCFVRNLIKINKTLLYQHYIKCYSLGWLTTVFMLKLRRC